MSRSSFLSLAALAVSFLSLAGCGGNNRGDLTCARECPGTQACCVNGAGEEQCVVTDADPTHCGACGNACGAGMTCSAGACVPMPDGGSCTGCSDAQLCCGAECVNKSVPSGTEGRLDPSFDHCGGCGLACDPLRATACVAPAGGTASCVCGAFGQCSPAEVCTNDGGVFRCVNTQTDRNNCGGLGVACDTGEICSAGICVCASAGRQCDPTAGEACCGGNCVVVTADDPNNCGGCGIVCGAGMTCSGGVCGCGGGPACAAPSATSLGQSCCGDVCVANTDTNCGCGVDCGSNTCIFAASLLGGPEQLCCGIGIPGLGGTCLDFSFDAGIGLDGGLGFDLGI